MKRAATARMSYSLSLVLGHERSPGETSGHLGARVGTAGGSCGSDRGSLEFVKGVAGGRRIDGKNHALWAVAGLFAVVPEGVAGQDRERHRGEVVDDIRSDGVESRAKANVGETVRSEKLGARALEGRLCHSVVLLVEPESDFVSDIGVNVLGVVNESGVWANFDVVVIPSEGQGQGEEDSEGSVEHHDVVEAGVVKMGLEK